MKSLWMQIALRMPPIVEWLTANE